MRLRPAAQRLLVAAAGIVIGLGLAELVLALVAPVDFRRPSPSDHDKIWRQLLHQPSDVSDLPYELRPNARGQARGAPVEVNAAGRRDAPERPAAERLLRVAVLGDSFTFGFGVEVEAAYPAQLETLLVHDDRLAGCGVDVLNFGVSGYNTENEAAQLRARVAPMHPAAIVIGYVLNDPQLDPIQPLQTHFAPVRWWQRFNLLRLVAQTKQAFDQKRYGDGDFFAYLHARAAGFWPRVEAAFDDIATVAASLQAPVFLLMFPLTPSDTWDDYAYGHLHAQVAEAARSRGMTVIDLFEPFSRHPPAQMRLDLQDEHPTPLAHAVVAEVLADRLMPSLVFACEARLLER